jgi:hypothetical protein
MISQNRPPPAFQEYASDTLANIDFRLLSLAERGLRTTMRLECWVNHYVPANPKELAIVLNLNITEVEKALTKRLLSFFVYNDGKLSCQDLENYRAVLLQRRLAQSAGGKNGGKKTQKINNEFKNQTLSSPQANLQPKVKLLRREEEKREESPRNAVTTDEIDSWVKDFTSNEYLKQSKGA